MAETSEIGKRFRIAPAGHSLSVFLVISYLLCVFFGLIAPEPMRMYEAWAPLLPGFEWLTVQGFFLGLLGAYLYGWYIALVFVPLCNFFHARG